MKKSEQTAATASIESQLKRLEEIASLLDRGELSVDEQLKIYEEGMALAQACRAYLENAQLKVEQLAGGNDQASARG
ncbi:MAG: exodeoxyribonuclease VII small subunit [Ignavibacteria bacterium]|jgi:exodeoxyribonuclease VII small subunit